MKDVWQCGRDYEDTAQTETVLRLSHGGHGVWVGEGWGVGQRWGGGRVGETPWSATHREFGDARTTLAFCSVYGDATRQSVV